MATGAAKKANVRFRSGEIEAHPPTSESKLVISDCTQEASQISVDVALVAIREVIAPPGSSGGDAGLTNDVGRPQEPRQVRDQGRRNPAAAARWGAAQSGQHARVALLRCGAAVEVHRRGAEDPKLAGITWPENGTDAFGAIRLTPPTVPLPRSGLMLNVRGAIEPLEITGGPVLRLGGHSGTMPLAKAIAPLANRLACAPVRGR